MTIAKIILASKVKSDSHSISCLKKFPGSAVMNYSAAVCEVSKIKNAISSFHGLTGESRTWNWISNLGTSRSDTCGMTFFIYPMQGIEEFF